MKVDDDKLTLWAHSSSSKEDKNFLSEWNMMLEGLKKFEAIDIDEVYPKGLTKALINANPVLKSIWMKRM